MLPPVGDAMERLASALRIFGETDGRWWEEFRQFDEARAIRHGAQWKTVDLEALQTAGRPAHTMNVIHNKIESVVGMNEDDKREALACPTGSEDQSVAEVLNAALRALRKGADLDPIDSQVYSEGVTVGEHSIALDVVSDDQNPTWVKVVATPVRGEEIAWDYGAKLPNRQDARYLFWSRWLTREEFLAEYPNRRKEVDALFDVDGFSQQYEGQQYYESEYDYKEEMSRTPSFVNHRTREVRVIRMEYKVPYQVWYVIGPDGKSMEVPKRVAQRWSSRYPVASSWKERVHWFEFIQNSVLFDAPAPVPFDGFSVVPFTCYHDTKTNYVYGLVRHLKDPQTDVNKAYSSSIEHLVAQGKPGYLAEHGAVQDQDAFEDSVGQGGTVAWLEDGALAGGKITERSVPVYSEGADRRLTRALELCDRISGIVMDAESPNRGQEAATTFLLRERKALRSMRSVLRNYHHYQREVATRLCQVIQRAMPDDQINVLIASPRLALADGLVVDRDRQSMQPFRGEQLRYNVELGISEKQETQRLAQLDLLERLAEKGVPIDPEVRIELAASTNAVRERLRDYYRQASAQASQAEQQAAQQAQQFQQGMLQVEQQKTVQDEISDRRKALLDREKTLGDQQLELLKVWEKADIDEKRFILETLRGPRALPQA